MKTIKKTFAFVAVSLFLAATVLANPLSKSQKDTMANQPEKQQSKLKKQMNQMIVSIADLDILTNRDEIADYEIFTEDADRILKAIDKIRKIDSAGVYKDLLDQLEKPTVKLKEYSAKKDPKAMKMPDQIFNACFRCHAMHRD